MVDTSRLLKSAFIIPVSLSLVLAPAWGFDIADTGTTPRTTPVDTASTTADLNDDATPAHELADSAAIIIDGTPQGNDEAAVLINSNGQNVLIKGNITIRDRDSDGALSTTALENAIGVKTTVGLPANINLRIGPQASIVIDEVQGPAYDGDRNGLPDANDGDADGIIEGAPAIGTFDRIGLWIAATGDASSVFASSIIGEAGSLIRVDGNGARGVQIDQALGGNFDFSTSISNLQSGGILGDNSVGVDINANIDGYYRQRGIIDVRGENSVGIDIDAIIGGALLVETGVNATGYSTIPAGSPGAPQPGGADFSNDDFDEFSELQRTANPQERRQSLAAVDIAAAIEQGVIINGPVNRIGTTVERNAFICRAEDEGCSEDGIIQRRVNDENVTALKTDPYHFDENRPRFNANGATASGAYLTSYGESEATLLIGASIGTALGATRETFLDIANDDANDDLYDSNAELFFSHGLINRNWIEANGLYDSVNNGAGYAIIRPATALKLNADAATIHGGIFNSGIISARARNADATAIDLRDGALTDGLRGDGAVFLNEGVIQALIASHTRSHVGITRASNTATAVKIAGSVDFEDSSGVAIDTPIFINAGTVSAASTHTQLNGATEAENDYETVSGLNFRAFDFSEVVGDIDLLQRLRIEDTTLSVNVDGEAGDETVYRASGDMEMDSNGDGVVDGRDMTAPSINGDIYFNGDDNDFTMTAGTAFGLIDFGGGANNFILGNVTNDDSDSYRTGFRGRIATSGTLDIVTGGQTAVQGETVLLHFDGQEGVDLNLDGDDQDIGEEANLQLGNLDLNENTELRFSVNPNFLGDNEAVLAATNFTMEDDVTLSLDVSRLLQTDRDLVLIEAANDLNAYDATINARSADNDYPFVYNVEFDIAEAPGANDKLIARIGLKTAQQMGLNQTESAALSAVLAHFATDEDLELQITSITDGDVFKSAYRQLLPHYSDGTAQQFSGLADMATGAVSQHLQLVNAGGRRGGDGWVQQFGDYRKQEAGVDGATVSGTSYAIALGYDLPVSLIDALGIYLQMGFSAVNEKSASTNEVKGDGISYGAYLSDKIGPWQYELNAAVGFMGLESTRLVNFNGLVGRTQASWDATSTAASARLAYPILQDAHMLRLEAGADFFRLEHDDYSENDAVGLGFAMQIDGGESEKTSQFIGLRGGYRRGGDDPVSVVWEPNYYLGWRTTSDISPYQATAKFVGADESFTLKSYIEPEDAIDLGIGLAAHNDYFAFEFNYRARIADDEETHGGGVSVRILF